MANKNKKVIAELGTFKMTRQIFVLLTEWRDYLNFILCAEAHLQKE